MRILQILPELNVGGVETGTVDFAKYLVRQGHHSVVVSNGGALVQDLVNSGSRHCILPVHKKSLRTILLCIPKLRAIIQKEHIDIVHARSRVPGWVAYFACRGTPAQFITTCHGFYSNHMSSRVMSWSKLVIVPSDILGRYIIETFRVPSDNIRVIARSVDLEKYQMPRDENRGKSHYVIGIIGRLTPLKGHSYFLKAMVKVIRSMPFVKIWIIGDVPAGKESYKQELLLLTKHLGLSAQVEFLGNRKDIPQLLSQMDVLVLSSIQPESFGRVILEAQASGVPVVATKIGGVMEIIEHEKTGLLVYPKDVEAMGDAVLRLLQDRKGARDMADEARRKVEQKFTLQQMAEKTLAVYEELLKTLNILVIKWSSLGDVILAMPALKAMRQKFPGAQISCLVGEESRIVLQRCPYLDELIVLDIKNRDKGWLALWRFASRLRGHKFDKIIDLQNNRRSHFLAALSFARESFGYDNGKWGFFLTRKIKDDSIRCHGLCPWLDAVLARGHATGKWRSEGSSLDKKNIPPIEHQFRILQMLDIPCRDDRTLELWPSAADRRQALHMMAEEWIPDGANVIGINLSASQKWKTKNWPLEYVARLCDALAAQGIRVIITGMENDREQARKLLSMTRTKPANFVGKTDVLQLAALIEKCLAYVTPDSAPMHMAAAMRVPFVALFGPTSSQRHLPPAKSFVVLERKLKCAPCYSAVCRLKTHLCLRDISPEEVFRHLQQLTQNFSKRS